MKRKLLILYSKNPDEIYSRQSALGSYIHSLSLLLEEKFDIYLNGEKKRSVTQNKIVTNSKYPSLKKIIPTPIKRIVNDLKLFRNQILLLQSIEGKYDLILEFYSYGSNVGYNISRHQKIPLFVVYDAPIIDEYVHFNKVKPIFSRRIERLEKQTLKQADSIVVYSEPVQHYLEKRYRLKNKFVIHQNIDFSRFEYLGKKDYGKELNICFIGSFLKWHRVDLLVDVFTMLRENKINAKLFLIGSGLEFENIKAMVAKNSFSNDIILTGFMDGKALSEIKAKMHIGVMPGSNWYGAPNKIFEYGAAKMAVIAPKTPTISYIFNEKTVMMFENDSKASLYDQLFKLSTNIELIKSKSELLFAFIKQNYSETQTQKTYYKMFDI